MKPALQNTQSALIDAFCDQLWLQDSLAQASLAAYRRDLHAWAGWLARRDATLHAAGRADVEAWLAEQFAAKAKATSIGRRLSALRRFYRLAHERGQVRDDPTLRVKAPKLPRRLPKNLSEKQVEALLAAPNVEQALGLRDRAMLETLYASGLRVSELVHKARVGEASRAIIGEPWDTNSRQAGSRHGRRIHPGPSDAKYCGILSETHPSP